MPSNKKDRVMSIQDLLTKQRVIAFAIVVVIAALGTYIVFKSHAQTPYGNVYAADGTLTGGATLVSGGSSSAGQAMEFGGASTTGVTTTSNSGFQEGDYEGYENTSAVKSFGSNTGTSSILKIGADYLSGSSWSTISGSGGDNFSAWKNAGYRLALGVPMLPSSGASLATGATGAYDSYFKTLAQNLVAGGNANAILHIGWEWDQSVNPWYVSNTTDATNLATYWQQIVTTMRAVPGANFDYAWYYGSASTDGTPGGPTTITYDAFPGSSYVSSIDLDFYDQTWIGGCGLPFNNTATAAQSQCVWNDSFLPVLNDYAAFAKQEGVPMGFGEWGVISRSDGHGLGDDPTYIQNMASWVSAHNIEYMNYFDFNSGGNSVLSSFPNSLAEYKSVMPSLTSTFQ